MNKGPYTLGVDFDNTIINYNDLLHAVACEQGLMNGTTVRGKKEIRDKIRASGDGKIKWQKVQAMIYGPRIHEATISPSWSQFVLACRQKNIPVYIISHKTVYAGYDQTRTNLQEAAMKWMERNQFFSPSGLGFSRNDVFFETTREKKIERIKLLACTHFIDDLEETFMESLFPRGVIKMLYQSSELRKSLKGLEIFSSWHELYDYFFA